MLPPAFLDAVRQRTTLSVLIGRTVKLQKAGAEFRACCPFHQEKSPSFYVNDAKAFYHCFGCGAHGDAIRWMTDNRGLLFVDAVRELALAAGLDMPVLDRASARKVARARGLTEALADAAGWFTAQLQGIGGAEARAILTRRGVTADTAATFGLGFAPDARGALRAALKDYGDPLLVEAGLLIAVDGKAPYDRFRGRLMIPIRDARGRVIAFGGRVIGDGAPKYLNSPETPLFDKGRTLYNIDRALPAARKSGRVIVVEGYLDVIALVQAGIDEVCAPLGTALTEFQIERLWQVTDAPVVFFDGDAAGQAAAIRVAVRALPLLAAGRTLQFARIAGCDPDEAVRTRGVASIEAAVSAATPLYRLLFTHALGSVPPGTPDAQAAFTARLDALCDKIVDRETRWQYRQAFRSLRKAPVASAARPIAALDIRRAYTVAVLRGLARHPIVIRETLEVIAAIDVRGEGEARALQLILDATLAETSPDAAAVDACFPGDTGWRGLALSFVRSDTPQDRARADLRKAIEHLATTVPSGKAAHG